MYGKKMFDMDESMVQKIVDYCSGTIGEEDFEQLKLWVRVRSENQEILEKYLRIYRESREIAFRNYYDASRSWEQLSGRCITNRRYRSKIYIMVVAASVLLLLLLSGWYYWLSSSRIVNQQIVPLTLTQPGEEHAVLELPDGEIVVLDGNKELAQFEQISAKMHLDSNRTLVYEQQEGVVQEVYHTIKVPIGGMYRFTLADGSKIWLNSASEIRYPVQFTGNKREVFLKGEVFLDVATDTLLPFVVHAGDMEIEVLGTAFNVSAYSEDNRVVTTLVRGCVRVSVGHSEMVQSPGEQTIWCESQNTLKKKKVDVALYTSWVRGRFEFEDLALRDIVRQLARWYGVEFEFVDGSCAAKRFTGGVRRDEPLLEFLQIVEQTTNVKFEYDDKKIMVKSY